MKDPNRDQIWQRDPRGQQNQDPRRGHKKARNKRRNHCPSHSKSGQCDATSQTSCVPKAGMREESLIRLVKSFIISHITYVAAYHRWLRHERLRGGRHRGVNQCHEDGSERDKHRSRRSREGDHRQCRLPHGRVTRDGQCETSPKAKSAGRPSAYCERPNCKTEKCE